jgi:signal transduction histidine kinase
MGFMAMMESTFVAYWVMNAASLFNTILLFWLGWTVFFNAQKRNGGTWLATIGLLLGGIFFATHTAMLDSSIEELIVSVRLWWYFFFTPIVILPYAWYLLMLWYAGFWDDFSSALHRHHRWGLALTTILVIALFAMLLFANPFAYNGGNSMVQDLVQRGGRISPLYTFLYPVTIFLCLAFAMNALRHPAPSSRMMGDLARRRARPWLLAASVVQCIVSLLVAGALGWLIISLRHFPIGEIVSSAEPFADLFDLLLISLISLTVVLMGKAIVSYEIFTGKTLPRQGFLRQWRGVVTVSLLTSSILAWCLMVDLRPVYSQLIIVVLMSFLFALLSWQFFKEREIATAQLRPFIASQHFYNNVLSSQNADERSDAQAMFDVLCDQILETRGAKLIPLGALAPLAGAPLHFPDEAHSPRASDETPIDIKVLCAAVETQQGRAWRIPLRDGRNTQNLNGVLLLAEKRNGGLYTEEEIDVARAGGERLLDALAAAALASRLMELQRQRMTETQMADHRARRALHDEVLPRLHTAMLMLGGSETDRAESQTLLANVHKEISELLRSMPSALAPSVAQLGLLKALAKSMEDEFARDFDAVNWNITPEAKEHAAGLSAIVSEVLFHAAREAIRNAAKYGRMDKSTFTLTISAQVEDEFRLTISDDGSSLNTTKNQSGSGQGLALHGTMMAVVGGKLAVGNNLPHGVKVELTLPLST